MKVFHAILFFTVLVAIAGCETRSSKAGVYNDRIMHHQYEISEGFSVLDSALNTYDSAEIVVARAVLNARITTGLRLLDTLNGFSGDTTLSMAARSLFSFYHKVANDEYTELSMILQKPDSIYTVEDQMRAWALDSIIRVRFKDSHDAFLTEQQTFWGKYNIVEKTDE
jgi:hypothetical protein